MVIVKFDRKKDRRELQTTSGASVFTFKAGFSKERTPDSTVSRIEPNILSITPTEDLPAGEFILNFGSGEFAGFDFGIHIPKKPK